MLLREFPDLEDPVVALDILTVSTASEIWTARRGLVSKLPAQVTHSVQSLAQAVSVFRDILANEPTQRISELLKPYFSDARLSFFFLIGTESLVTVSNVICAFQGKMEPWTPNDLDLIVPHVACSDLYQYLASEE